MQWGWNAEKAWEWYQQAINSWQVRRKQCQSTRATNSHQHASNAPPWQVPPAVETDCGAWCGAYAFNHEDVPFTHFSHAGYRSGLTMVYDAEAMWQHVQCMGTCHLTTTHPLTIKLCPQAGGPKSDLRCFYHLPAPFVPREANTYCSCP